MQGFVPLVAAAAVIASALWVYGDALRRAQRGRSVTFRAGSVSIDTPEMWAMACLVLWVFFFPLYLSTSHR